MFPVVFYRKAETVHGHNFVACVEGVGAREFQEFCLYLQKEILKENLDTIVKRCSEANDFCLVLEKYPQTSELPECRSWLWRQTW